jgi:predicted nucleic acid-binding protein
MADLDGTVVGIDTAIFVSFIYFIEEHPRFLPVLDPLFEAADAGRRMLATSVLTLLEVLVVPYRAGNQVLADRYEALLTRSRGIRVIDLGREQLRAAAKLRAVTGIKTPDALQVVAALTAGCSTFLTTDRRLPRIPGLRVLQLESYVAG